MASEYAGEYAGSIHHALLALLASEYVGEYACRHSKNEEHFIDSSGWSVAPEKTALLFLEILLDKQNRCKY